MPAKTTKTEYVDAFAAEHANIRACVLSADGCTFYTWLFSGAVMRSHRGSDTHERAGSAWNKDMFNSVLEANGVARLSVPAEPKRPERLTP